MPKPVSTLRSRSLPVLALVQAYRAAMAKQASKREAPLKSTACTRPDVGVGPQLARQLPLLEGLR